MKVGEGKDGASAGGGDARDSRRSRELEALHAVMVATGSDDDLALTAERTLEVVCGVAHVQVGGVLRFDRASQTLVLIAHRGFRPDDIEGLRVRSLDRSHVGEVIRSGRPVVTDLTASRVLTPDVAERVKASGYRTQLALPIPVNGETWGVMALITREARTFDPDELTLLQAVAHQVGQAVARAALLADGREKSRRLETLARLAQTMTATLSLDDVFRRVVDAAIELFGSSAAELWLVDDDDRHVSRRAAAGIQSSAHGVERMRLGQGLVGTVVATRQSVTAIDALRDPRARNVERVRAEGVVSVGIVPLQMGERVLGALAIGARVRHEYTADELRLLGSLASHAANAINNAQHYTEARRRGLEAEELARLARTLTESLDPHAVGDQIAESVLALFQVRSSVLRLLQADGSLVMLARGGRFRDASHLGAVLPAGIGASGRAVADGRAVMSADLFTDPAIVLSDEAAATMRRAGDSAVLAVPLRAKDRIIGTLSLGDAAGRIFTEAEVRLLQAVGDQAALALENARLYEQNRRQVEELSVLLELSRAVTGQVDRATLLEAIRAQVGRILDAAYMAIVLRDEERGDLEVVLRTVDGTRDLQPPLRYPSHSVGLMSVVLETGEAIRTDDYVAECARRRVEPVTTFAGFRHWLGVPMRAADAIIGVLTVRSVAQPFVEADERLLTNIAHLAALALRNARLFEERTRAYSELAAAQDQLVRTEKLRALGEMASGVAHDFNNLLASILGRAQLTLQRLQDPQLRRWIQVIERAALDGAQTVRRLQEFTRIRRDQPFVAVDLNDVVRGALEITQSRWREETRSRDVAVDVRTFFGSIPRVAGDPAELREAMTNLILNAVDAMPAGGTLTLGTSHEEGEVVVTVADSGVGIPEAIRGRIFDPFFTTKGPQGTGLGLSMTYGILSRHGARITVESHEGRGTVFRMTFAPGEAPDLEGPSPADAPAPLGVSLRCLVVDDEEQVGAMLGDVLETGGHRVVVLADGAEAIDRFRAEAFDLVFTDLAMPRVSGWQVAQAVKAIAPTVPVILVTGFGVELSAEERRAQGVDLVIVKPLKINDVLDVVARAARRRVQRP